MASASFFAGARNVTIVGGEFNDIKGNLTVFDQSRHHTNLGSNNWSNHEIIDSYNDNSTTIGGPYPYYSDEGDDPMQSMPSRSSGYRDEEDDPMQSTSSTSAGNSRGKGNRNRPPPPQRPPFMPQQVSSEGGNVTNLDSFNVKNTNINDVSNDYSENHYFGRPPPMNKERRDGPPGKRPREEVDDDEDAQPNRGPHGRNGAPRQAPFPMGNGVGSGPFATVNGGNIQQMDPNMRRNFEKLMKFTLSQTQSAVPEESHEPNDDDDPPYPTVEPQDSVNTGMANLSINDPTSRQHQVATHPSPPPTFSRTKSDPQMALHLTTPQPRGPSPPASLSPYANPYQQSHSNPSLAPHMQEPAMVGYLTQPNAAHPADIHEDVPNGTFPASTSAFNFPPSSSGGPKFNSYYGDLTKHDTSVHQTNISSFNTEHNTIQNSCNDNSLVDFSGKKKEKTEKTKNPEVSEPDGPIKNPENPKKKGKKPKRSTNPQRPEEFSSSHERDEAMDQSNEFTTTQVPTAPEVVPVTVVDSPGKKKESKKRWKMSGFGRK